MGSIWQLISLRQDSSCSLLNNLVTSQLCSFRCKVSIHDTSTRVRYIHNCSRVRTDSRAQTVLFSTQFSTLIINLSHQTSHSVQQTISNSTVCQVQLTVFPNTRQSTVISSRNTHSTHCICKVRRRRPV